MNASGGATSPEAMPAMRWQAWQLPLRRCVAIQPPCTVTGALNSVAASAQVASSGASPWAAPAVDAAANISNIDTIAIERDGTVIKGCLNTRKEFVLP